MNARKRRGSVDEFLRAVYDSLSVRVLADAAADAPPDGEADLDALDAAVGRARDAAAASGGPAAVTPARMRPAEKKRARS